MYVRDVPKTQMRRYAEKWQGLPVPRLQLRWAPKPVPNSDPARAKAIRRDKSMSKSFGRDYLPGIMSLLPEPSKRGAGL